MRIVLGALGHLGEVVSKSDMSVNIGIIFIEGMQVMGSFDIAFDKTTVRDVIRSPGFMAMLL